MATKAATTQRKALPRFPPHRTAATVATTFVLLLVFLVVAAPLCNIDGIGGRNSNRSDIRNGAGSAGGEALVSLVATVFPRKRRLDDGALSFVINDEASTSPGAAPSMRRAKKEKKKKKKKGKNAPLLTATTMTSTTASTGSTTLSTKSEALSSQASLTMTTKTNSNAVAATTATPEASSTTPKKDITKTLLSTTQTTEDPTTTAEPSTTKGPSTHTETTTQALATASATSTTTAIVSGTAPLVTIKTSPPSHDHGDALVYRPKPFPCELSSGIDADIPRGVYYVKIPKTNSTHWRDVAIRSAVHVGTDLGRECYRDTSHMDVGASNLRNRDPDRSLLLTFLRDVRDWKVANYYHKLAVDTGARPSVAGMAKFVQKRKNGQAKYIRNLEPFDSYGAQSTTDVARAILAEYDFVGVVEDAERSLVCFRLLYDLPPESILYNPSHLAGTISFRKGDKSECSPILPNYIFPEVEEVMSGEQWVSENAIDLALYEEAKRSLEATIDSIGRVRFEKALAEHRKLMQRVREQCLPVVRYRCDDEGIFHKDDDCGGQGCGYNCIRDLIVGGKR